MEKAIFISGPRKKELRWYVCKATYGTIPYREKLQEACFKFFLPTYFEMKNIGGRKVRVEKPSVMNYIFVYADAEELYDFTKRTANLRAVLKPAPKHREDIRSYNDFILSIPDRQMEMFMKSIGQYDKAVPFFKPNEVELEKGDLVRIIGGPFEGVEGVLMTSQGKDGGRVMMSVGNLAIMPTLEIEPKYIQVLEFAKKGKHLYKKFDSFIEKARVALDHFHNPKSVKPSDLVKDNVAMQQFVQRFGELYTPTVNARLKLKVFMLVCYTCLGKDDLKKKTIDNIKDILKTVNSEINKAFAFTMLYRCTLDEKYKKQALKITSTWGELRSKDKQKREILKDLGIIK